LEEENAEEEATNRVHDLFFCHSIIVRQPVV